jgi:hypothetical protein
LTTGVAFGVAGRGAGLATPFFFFEGMILALE